MGAVKAHTLKELIKQAEIAKKSAKKFETPKSRWEIKAKVMTRLNLLIHQHWKYIEELDQRKVTPIGLQSIRDNTLSKMSMCDTFHLLNKGNKLKLPETRRPNEVGRMNDPSIVFSIGWFIILLAGEISLTTKSKR